MSSKATGLSEQQFERIVHSRLDSVDVPVRPWAPVLQDLRRRLRKRRARLAAVVSSAVGAAAVVTVLALVLPGQARQPFQGRTPQGAGTGGCPPAAGAPPPEGT